MANESSSEMVDKRAEGLTEGADSGGDLPALQPERHGALEGLLILARRLRSAFAPLEPPPTFVADLKRQLLANAERVRAAARRRQERKQKAIVAAVGVGGFVYVMGLTAMGVRLILSFFGMLLGIILGWRRPSQKPRGAR
ncbi:MAG: hypothetical protein HY260_00020 [Chloroflexi bacterium]|nr:hypothetical protein [Chloroflexota bacterium]